MWQPPSSPKSSFLTPSIDDQLKSTVNSSEIQPTDGTLEIVSKMIFSDDDYDENEEEEEEEKVEYSDHRAASDRSSLYQLLLNELVKIFSSF